MIDTLFLRPSLHFTTFHYTCRHFTSSLLNSTHLHFTTFRLHFTTWRNNRHVLILRAVHVTDNIALYSITNYMKLEIKPNGQPTDRPTHHRQTDRHTDRPTHQPTNWWFVTVGTTADLLCGREGTAIRLFNP